MDHIIVLAGKPRCRAPHVPLLAMSAPVAEFDLDHLSRDNVPAAAGVAVIDCGTATDEGLRLLTEVKAGRPDLPVILVSPVATDDIVAAAFRRGAREFFEKPVDEERLRDMVDFLLEVKRKKSIERVVPAPTAVADRDYMQKFYSTRALEPLNARGRTGRESALKDFLERLRFSPEFRRQVRMTPLQFMNLLRGSHGAAHGTGRR